tara:strand:+ start:255 stop:404 length:150 start_codon:yes stop_codon:yes gene_type:complete
MKFLNTILQRPSTEKQAMILVAGYPEADTHVPDITRKTLDQITGFYNGA